MEKPCKFIIVIDNEGKYVFRCSTVNYHRDLVKKSDCGVIGGGVLDIYYNPDNESNKALFMLSGISGDYGYVDKKFFEGLIDHHKIDFSSLFDYVLLYEMRNCVDISISKSTFIFSEFYNYEEVGKVYFTDEVIRQSKTYKENEKI